LNKSCWEKALAPIIVVADGNGKIRAETNVMKNRAAYLYSKIKEIAAFTNEFMILH